MIEIPTLFVHFHVGKQQNLLMPLSSDKVSNPARGKLYMYCALAKCRLGLKQMDELNNNGTQEPTLKDIFKHRVPTTLLPGSA